MMSQRVAATRIIARLTVARALRGRALWISAIVATLPIFFAYVLRAANTERGHDTQAVDLFAFQQLALAVLTGMLVAASVGEDIEDRTTTYLWSRPLPRSSVLTGKLLAMAPIVCGLAIASWCAAAPAATRGTSLDEINGPPPLIDACIALGLGGLALSLVAAAIATLVPRYAMALTVCYLLFFDIPMGALPAAIENVSVTHHIRTVAGMTRDLEASRGAALIGMAIIAAIWTTVGLWRIRRLEA
jgi:ABC-type transport system involved in multi-copper enzyme maturation permease subunit